MSQPDLTEKPDGHPKLHHIRGRHLSKQALAVLKDVWALSEDGELVFPSARNKLRPLSENAFTVAIRRTGYAKGEVTAHGFRATASTIAICLSPDLSKAETVAAGAPYCIYFGGYPGAVRMARVPRDLTFPTIQKARRGSHFSMVTQTHLTKQSFYQRRFVPETAREINASTFSPFKRWCLDYNALGMPGESAETANKEISDCQLNCAFESVGHLFTRVT